MKRKILTIISLSINMYSFAGGYKIGLQGQKQIGMASCGTGLAMDASTIYYNAGALAFTPNQITIGGSGLMPNTQYLDAATQTITNATSKTFTPFAVYGSYGITKKLVAGFGIYTPFGSGVQYPSNWTGRYILTDINLQTVFIKPTISYKINNNFSVGAGFVYSSGSVNLENDIPVQSQTSTDIGHAKLNGKASGIGFDAGVYYQKNKLSAGLAYRSKVNMNINNGTNTFTNIPTSVSSNFPNGTFTSKLPLPSEIALGFGYQATKKILLALDWNYTFWKSYDTLSFDFANNTANVADIHQAKLYKNAMALRLGAQYVLNTKCNLRGGLFFDATPINDGYVGPETPDANRFGATIGASYLITPKLSIDASIMYENVAKRTQQNLATNLNGTFATKVFAPGIGISYKFNKKTSTK